MKNRLILIETEMKGPKGHYLNNLIDTSLYFKKKLNISWILNDQFKSMNTFIPKKIKISKILKTNTYNKKSNKLLFYLEEIKFFVFNLFYIFYYLVFFIKEKKLRRYVLALKSNYFLLPKYFQSFYEYYKSLGLKKNDHIFFPTARRKDIALINFLSKIDNNHPKFHMRVFLPPKIKFKSFFYYLREIDNLLKSKMAFVYLWSDYNYKLFKEQSISKVGIYKSNIPWTFYNRKGFKKNLVVGYVGDARKSRGFQHLPDLIKSLYKKNNSLKYLIQFSKISNDLKDTRKELYGLAKRYKQIKIIEKYLDYRDFINYLKKIDIMPILHEFDEINKVTSGTMYSCIPYQIPFVAPKGTIFLKNINKYKSYEIAKNIKDYSKRILQISKNYNFYLKNIKKNSLILKKILDKDPLKINIINN